MPTIEPGPSVFDPVLCSSNLILSQGVTCDTESASVLLMISLIRAVIQDFARSTLWTQPFVLPREDVFFWRLFCIECRYSFPLEKERLCVLTSIPSCSIDSSHWTIR